MSASTSDEYLENSVSPEALGNPDSEVWLIHDAARFAMFFICRFFEELPEHVLMKYCTRQVDCQNLYSFIYEGEDNPDLSALQHVQIWWSRIFSCAYHLSARPYRDKPDVISHHDVVGHLYCERDSVNGSEWPCWVYNTSRVKIHRHYQTSFTDHDRVWNIIQDKGLQAYFDGNRNVEGGNSYIVVSRDRVRNHVPDTPVTAIQLAALDVMGRRIVGRVLDGASQETTSTKLDSVEQLIPGGASFDAARRHLTQLRKELDKQGLL